MLFQANLVFLIWFEKLLALVAVFFVVGAQLFMLLNLVTIELGATAHLAKMGKELTILEVVQCLLIWKPN